MLVLVRYLYKYTRARRQVLYGLFVMHVLVLLVKGPPPPAFTGLSNHGPVPSDVDLDRLLTK